VISMVNALKKLWALIVWLTFDILIAVLVYLLLFIGKIKEKIS